MAKKGLYDLLTLPYWSFQTQMNPKLSYLIFKIIKVSPKTFQQNHVLDFRDFRQKFERFPLKYFNFAIVGHRIICQSGKS